jgi:hypothetical protein
VFGLAAGAVFGALASGANWAFGSAGALLFASAICVLGAVQAMRIPAWVEVTEGEVPASLAAHAANAPVALVDDTGGDPPGQGPVWIHDFGVTYTGDSDVDLGRVRDVFQDAFAAILRGEAESDGFNRLVLRARLTWRQIVVLRAYCKYLRQTRLTFSQEYMEQALANNPQIARLSPTWARIVATWSSITLAVVQDGVTPAISYRKCSRTACPCSLWSTSGWNCTPASRRSASSKAATGVWSVRATTRNPSGAAVTASPCDIQTDCRRGSPWNSVESGPTTSSGVPPNSACPVRWTDPPSAWAIAWNQ